MAPEQALGERVSSAATCSPGARPSPSPPPAGPRSERDAPRASSTGSCTRRPTSPHLAAARRARRPHPRERPRARPAPEQLLVEVVRAAMAGQLPPAIPRRWRRGARGHLAAWLDHAAAPAASSTATRPRRHRRLLWAAARSCCWRPSAVGSSTRATRARHPRWRHRGRRAGEPSLVVDHDDDRSRPAALGHDVGEPAGRHMPDSERHRRGPTVTPPSSQTVSVPGRS